GAREPNVAVGCRGKWGKFMFIGCKPHRAAKLALAGSMLALAASLAAAQQPPVPAPAAPATQAAPPAPASPATPGAPSAATPGAPSAAPPPAPAAQSAPAVVPPVPASTPDQEKLRLLGAKRYPGK